MNLIFNHTGRNACATVKNRRATRRYGVRASFRYRAADCALNCAWKPGRTLDMSAGGVLIEITEEFPLNSRLELLMDWPGLYLGRPTVRLSLTATVKRVDGGRTALRIDDHQFGEVRPSMIRPKRNLAVA